MAGDGWGWLKRDQWVSTCVLNRKLVLPGQGHELAEDNICDGIFSYLFWRWAMPGDGIIPTLCLFNIANWNIPYKWRFIDGKIIYQRAIFHGYVYVK